MLNTPRLGWGIISTGKVISNHIAPAIDSLDSSALAAVYSRDYARAEAFVSDYPGATPYDDYDQMLTDPAVQAVYIASPNALHANQVLTAARAGKHVLCDKPLATSAVVAENLVDECDAAGVSLGITFQTRFHEGMATIRKAIADGAVGSVITGHLEMSSGRTLLSGWRTDPEMAGLGVVNNIGVHGYDLLRYLLGAEITEVSAMTSAEDSLALDTTAVALLRFDTGPIFSVQVNQAVPHHQPDLVIYGSAGRIVGHNVTRHGLTGTVAITTSADERMLNVSSANAYRDLVNSFNAAILDQRSPKPSGRDGLVSVQVTAALAEAAASGRTVAVGR